MKRSFLAIAAIVYFSVFGTAFGQTGEANGGIHGAITDPSGGFIRDAKVRATNLSTGFQREAQTNERGEYEVPLLPLGKYRVDVSPGGLRHSRNPACRWNWLSQAC
jgi:hypothetical protein